MTTNPSQTDRTPIARANRKTIAKRRRVEAEERQRQSIKSPWSPSHHSLQFRNARAADA